MGRTHSIPLVMDFRDAWDTEAAFHTRMDSIRRATENKPAPKTRDQIVVYLPSFEHPDRTETVLDRADRCIPFARPILLTINIGDEYRPYSIHRDRTAYFTEHVIKTLQWMRRRAIEDETILSTSQLNMQHIRAHDIYTGTLSSAILHSRLLSEYVYFLLGHSVLTFPSDLGDFATDLKLLIRHKFVDIRDINGLPPPPSSRSSQYNPMLSGGRETDYVPLQSAPLHCEKCHLPHPV